MSVYEPAKKFDPDASTDKLTKAELKRKKILEAAAKIFGERGYAQTTLADIAEAAGTQAGSMYYHFESRDHIVREVLAKAMSDLNARVAHAINALPPTATPVDKIRTGLRTQIKTSFSDDPFIFAYHRISDQVTEEIRTEFMVHANAYRQYWTKLFEEAKEEGYLRADLDLTVFRLLIFGTLSWSANWYTPNGRLSAPEIADEMLKVLIEGCAAKQPL